MDDEYLMALKSRVKEILTTEDEDKKVKSKPKTKKDQTEEQKQRIIDNLAKAREKAAIVRKQKKEIKEAQIKEKQDEFENLKKKYLKPKENEKEIEKPKETTPKRERVIPPPYQEEKAPEPKEEIKEPPKSQPVDIPKPEPVKEKVEDEISYLLPRRNIHNRLTYLNRFRHF